MCWSNAHISTSEKVFSDWDYSIGRKTKPLWIKRNYFKTWVHYWWAKFNTKVETITLLKRFDSGTVSALEFCYWLKFKPVCSLWVNVFKIQRRCCIVLIADFKQAFSRRIQTGISTALYRQILVRSLWYRHSNNALGRCSSVFVVNPDKT